MRVTLAVFLTAIALIAVTATATGAPKPSLAVPAFSGVRVINDEGQTLQGPLWFTEAVYDVGGYCALSCSELIAPSDGYYRFCATVQAYLPDATYFQLVLNTREEADNDIFGTDRTEHPNQDGPTYLHACKDMHAAAGDRFQVSVGYQPAEDRYVLGGADIERIG